MLPQPGNSDHLGYRVYHGKPPNGEGQWATQKTLNSIFDVAEALGDASLFQIGDLSLENSALFHTGRGHRDGTAFDVRPVRRDRKQQPVQWNWTESYDREATQRLVDVLLAAGAKKILFNDPKIEGVTPWEGHDNHLHVAF